MNYQENESKGFSWNKKMGIAAASLMLAGAGMFGAAAVVNASGPTDTVALTETAAGSIADFDDGVGTSPAGSASSSGAGSGSGGPAGTGGDSGSSQSDSEPSEPPSGEPNPDPSDPPSGDPVGPGGWELPDEMAPPAADPNPTPKPKPELELAEDFELELQQLTDGK
jgi:hypothetical protein